MQDLDPDLSLAEVSLHVGPPLQPGQPSPTGLYAVCKSSGWPLRVTLFQSLAEWWRDPTRPVHVCYADVVKEEGTHG